MAMNIIFEYWYQQECIILCIECIIVKNKSSKKN